MQSVKSLLCHFFLFLSCSILLHNPLFAKPTSDLLVADFQGSRLLKIDIQRLRKDDPNLKPLRELTTQHQDKLHAENQFIKSYIHALEGNFDASAQAFKKIPAENLLRPLANLYWFVLKSRTFEDKNPSLESIREGLKQLQKLLEQLPLSASSTLKNVLHTYKLHEWAYTNEKPVTTSILDHFFDTLSRTSLSTEHRNRLIRALHEQVLRQPPTTRDLFYHHVQSAYGSDQDLSRMIPKRLKTKSISTPPIQLISPQAAALLNTGEKERKQGNYDQALTLFAAVLNQYPQSKSAHNAQKEIRSILQNLVRQDTQLERYTKALSMLPPLTLYTEGRYLWNQEENDVARAMFLTFIEKFPFHEKCANALFILGRIEENIENFEKAKTYFQMVVDRFTTSEFYHRARFKVGLHDVLLKEYAQAIKTFDAILSKPDSSTLRKAQTLYWKAIAQERNKQSAKDTYQTILTQYPYTYYATVLPKRPRKAKKSTPQKRKKVQMSAYASRIKTYLSVGLHKLVRAELDIIRTFEPDEQLLMTRYLDAAGFYQQSMNLTFKRFEQIPILYPDMLDLFFPIAPYHNFFDPTQDLGVDPLVAISIMKQESAFNPNAASAANAHGLMQLIMPTAKNMARKHKMQIRIWDLYVPQTNILLGTSYLEHNLERFDQNLVDTLIAYNAGPTRAKRWRNRWDGLDEATYIEMIPIQETRTYVKLILRNMYYYRTLHPDLFPKVPDFKGLPDHFIE